MDRLVKESEIGYSRWQSVRYKNIRMSSEELEVLQGMFPEFQLWLISGNIAPEVGQVSPEYEIADAKLQGRSGE
ncbi:hypothetical protein [Alcanivorax sp. IL2]|uniref:hypothetical protein n=1 Tax=Alcanivorax sp. IL2 TaxID=3396310 RepID=UPI0039C31E46